MDVKQTETDNPYTVDGGRENRPSITERFFELQEF